VAYFVLDHAAAPGPGVTLGCYDRLRDGMAVDRVGAVLGRPCDSEEALVEPRPDGEADAKVSCRDGRGDGGEVGVSVRFRPGGTA
jgi:hypothetical protein